MFRGSVVFFCLLISKTLPMGVFLLSHFTGVTIILRGRSILFWGIGFDFFSILIEYLFRIFVTVIHFILLVCFSFYWLFTLCSSLPKRGRDDPNR
ncbi:hypothetical protein GIB67_012231 [Kingdonia uniflora]|uniref:Uncharacterized protein n=1 Tax=Kingdonia uniflora TaxID=39325 RepID=A0A7J7NI18_9MAGN|nr:hypothetical protein GIB67_012231 [Kingdonia uniflora]